MIVPVPGAGCKLVEERRVSCDSAGVTMVRAALRDGADSLRNEACLPMIATGGSGNDVITGGIVEDVIAGGPGGDTLYGNERDDQLTGGEGNDRLEGWGGADELIGGLGDDQLEGGDDGDDLSGASTEPRARP